MPYPVNPNVMYDVYSPTALKDRVAIITGGGTGLGKAIATEFAKVGCHLVLAARNMERLDAAAEEIRQYGTKVTTVQTDIRHVDQVKNMVQHTVDEFGRIDIMVNNAAGRFDIPTENLSRNGWYVVVNIVLNGTWYCSQEAGKQMIKQGGGSIINIISNSAWLGSVYVAHSAAAKAGVWSMTKTLAAEWGKYNIRVNGIAPLAPVGPTINNRSSLPQEVTEGDGEGGGRDLPLGRTGVPQEIAWAALFLASDAASYVTGHCLDVTGASWLGRRPQGRQRASAGGN